jgi:hypothetical protein
VGGHALVGGGLGIRGDAHGCAKECARGGDIEAEKARPVTSHFSCQLL